MRDMTFRLKEIPHLYQDNDLTFDATAVANSTFGSFLLYVFLIRRLLIQKARLCLNMILFIEEPMLQVHSFLNISQVFLYWLYTPFLL